MSRREWSRESIIEAIQRWEAQYGEPPSAQDWNTAMARQNGRLDLVERFYAGSWPYYGSIGNYFGSWNDAIRAAGLVPRGIGKRGGAPPLTDAEQHRARALHVAGYGTLTIARELGTSRRPVAAFLHAHGLRRTKSEAVALANRRKRKAPA